jgi:hypothetical protein
LDSALFSGHSALSTYLLTIGMEKMFLPEDKERR